MDERVSGGHNNKERKRGGHGGRPRVSVTWKLFGYLAFFTGFILLVVWVFQIGLLNYFYKQSKYDEMVRAEEALGEAMEEGQPALSSAARDAAEEYAVCVRVFDLYWVGASGYANELASADVSRDCLIHHVSDRALGWLYKKAVDGGGLYTLSVYPNGQTSEAVDPSVLPDLGTPSGRGSKGLMRSLTDGENVLRVRLIERTDGGMVMILLNAELSPLDATVRTLKTQFWYIAVILLCGAVLLAALIARNISRPIERMNAAAKRLAKGEYDADFSVGKAGAYREAMELSDSLTDAAYELSRTDALRRELLANISHDLRTPLTMIKGYGEVMRDIPGENTPENVQVIIDETERLSELVNDLLDLSKLQAGTRRPTPERFCLTDVVESVMARYARLTERDGYRIEVSVDAPVDVVADRTMILQVVYNLTNNAVNYTGEDKLVRVAQRVLGDSGRVRISVTDDGPGIPPEEIPLIWDRYYKVDKVHRRAAVGTGLGLSIVKQILEQHGSTYGVESKLGEGSTFWFELPVAEEETE